MEKYSGEVKSALSTLLEQDEMDLSEDDPVDSTFTEDVPYAFQTEELDAPGADELVEIDFDQLKARIAEEEAAGEEVGHDDLTDALGMADDLQEDGYITNTMLDDDAEEDAASLAGATDREELEEDINLTEEMLSDLIEELVVDMTPPPQRGAPLNPPHNPPLEQANNDAMAAAQDAHLEEEEGIEEERSTASDVVSDATLYESRIADINESNVELRALIMEAKNQLTKLNLENAKLVYQNKALKQRLLE